MMRWKLSVTLFCLGITTLAAGLTLYLTAPSAQRLESEQRRRDDLRREVKELEAMEPVTAAELEDLLPPRQSMGKILAALNQAAKKSRVGPLTLESNDSQATSQTAATAGSEDAGETLGLSASAIRCVVEVEADFSAVTRFLGLIESSVPVMRIESLELVPSERGLHAIATLTAYYFDSKAGD